MRNIFDINDDLHAADDIPSVLKWGHVQENPMVSIVMPVYNHPQFFRLALESVLNQDFTSPYEIIVVDNNMDDNVNNINEFEQYVIEKNDPRVLYYKNAKNIRAVNNFNRGPQLAHAPYFVYLHDDDELCPDCLSTLFRVKEKYHVTDELIVSSPMLVFEKEQGHTSQFQRNSKVSFARKIVRKVRHLLKAIDREDYRMTLFEWFYASHTNGGGCLHSKKAFERLGGYSNEFSPSGDYALYILYAYHYGAIHTSHPIYRYRIAENDASGVYLTTIERDVFFRTCMMDKICIPNFILRPIIQARKSVTLQTHEKLWKGQSNHTVTFKERKLDSIAQCIRKISVLIKNRK